MVVNPHQEITIPGMNMAKNYKYNAEWKDAGTEEYLYMWFHKSTLIYDSMYTSKQQAKQTDNKISHNTVSSGGDQLRNLEMGRRKFLEW